MDIIKDAEFIIDTIKIKNKNNLSYSKTVIKSNKFHFKFIIGDLINHKYKVIKNKLIFFLLDH